MDLEGSHRIQYREDRARADEAAELFFVHDGKVPRRRLGLKPKDLSAGHEMFFNSVVCRGWVHIFHSPMGLADVAESLGQAEQCCGEKAVKGQSCLNAGGEAAVLEPPVLGEHLLGAEPIDRRFLQCVRVDGFGVFRFVAMETQAGDEPIQCLFEGAHVQFKALFVPNIAIFVGLLRESSDRRDGLFQGPRRGLRL